MPYVVQSLRFGSQNMKRSAPRRALYLVLLSLYLLHNDLWLWDNPLLVVGIPVSLVYHIAFCVAASLLMLGLVRYAWPRHLSSEPIDDEPLARQEAA